ncbi:MAG: T9SS type A sorting domain-containing protein [Bacteroidales bacterium]|nr:T9SS type A sorting domain-containing protein [Bacteroidales bacterium]
MKKTLLIFASIFISAMVFSQTPWTGRTYCKITLDTKAMENPSCSLGGGGGIAATWDKVYAHLGLCTCDIEADVRDCSSESENEIFCFSQITPFQSLVWQHVVGNWGDIAEDDGVGLMTALGDGVYSLEFIVEDYFSSADVSTQLGETSAVPSMPWNVNLGGKPYTMGMVFRNIDGTSSGRDKLCKDLFLVDILGDPKVIQGSEPEGPEFLAMAVDVHDAGIEEIMALSDNTMIFPNPAKDEFNLSFKLVKNNTDVQIRIFDALGKIVLHEVYDAQNIGWYNHSIKTMGFEQGIYMVQISLDNYISHTERVQVIR